MLWRTVENSTRLHSVGNFIDLSNKIFYETIVSIFKEEAKVHACNSVFTLTSSFLETRVGRFCSIFSSHFFRWPCPQRSLMTFHSFKWCWLPSFHVEALVNPAYTTGNVPEPPKSCYSKTLVEGNPSNPS